MRTAALLVALCLGVFSRALIAAEPVAATVLVEGFTPQGDAKQVRQVTARFSAPMVALGDPRLPDPFDIQCAATGQGRWADERNWVLDFDADLPAGQRCRFTLRKDLKAQDGRRVTPVTYAFSTGGPAILRSYPREGWTTIDEEQLFLLRLDAAATAESVQAHARCIVSGLAEQLPVEVLTGDARAAVLSQTRSIGYEYFQLLWKSGAQSLARVRDRELDRAEADITVLRCQRRLPPAADVQLLWGRGIQTVSGIQTSQEQKLAFRVRRAFTAQAECTRANARAGCLPMLPVSLRFSAPVPRDAALAIRLKLADGRLRAPIAPPQSAEGAVLESVQFAPPFPENKPLRIVLPAALGDDAGRKLENAARFPLEMRVDAMPPLAKFAGRFGILEAREGGVLPVTLRNLEPDIKAVQLNLPAKLLRLDEDPAVIARWLRRVEQAEEPRGKYEEIPPAERASAQAVRPQRGTDEEDDAEGDASDPTQRWREDTGTTSVFDAADAPRRFTVPRPAGRKAFEVVGIPLKDPGFYVVEIESGLLGASLLGRDQPRYVSTAALVTDLAVHFKWGRESSLVWVTRLSDGKPVAGADLRIVDYCSGSDFWQGVTDADGAAAVGPTLGVPTDSNRCETYLPHPLFVVARKDGDLSFAQSGWNQGIGPEQFSLPGGSDYSARIYHTVLDRALFRAGETVSMKHFIRRHTIKGFEISADLPAGRTVRIVHAGSGQEYTLKADFDRSGIAESQWKIPAEAKLGDYAVYLVDGTESRLAARFKVEQFRLPSMRASVTGPGEPPVRPSSVDLDLHVAYLSGGGASGLPVKLRTLLRPTPVAYPGYEDYAFGGKPVVEGLVNDEGTAYDYDAESQEGEAATADGERTRVVPLTLDGAGSARVSVGDLPEIDTASVLTAELEYTDANGEILTTSGRVRLLPSAFSVGVRSEGWAGSREQLRFRVVVLDQKGQPVAQRRVSVALYQAQRYSYRKRLIGGFYAYETTRDTRRLGASCAGVSDAQGLITCEVAPGVSGEILIRAETADGAGRTSGATTSAWVFDGEESWFGGTAGDRMDVLPEKKSYEAGQTARFQVRMPFREATALVTVERQGVMSRFVTQLDGRSPVIEVPIADNYAPNVFVSVLAVRGRVARADRSAPGSSGSGEITALVDLRKPAFRLGMASIKVGWKPHRLDVRVTPSKPAWRVRERADVKIHVARADGGSLPAGAEVAVVAVDSALLELAPNHSWDLLAQMMGEHGIEVRTSTGQMQVVGKRHYGRKAVTSGGGGGRDRAREMFDSLLFWKGRVNLDAQGDASVSIPLNDSLSEFRIVAVANGSAGYFGTGSTLITTSQDLILVSGLPPLVREADRFLATVTLRNTSDRTITVDVSGTKSAANAQPLQKQRVELPAGQSRDVAWRVEAPVGASQLVWEVTAQEAGGSARDRLRVTQQVVPAFPVRTYQATLTQLDAAYSLPVARPATAIAGRGGLEVTLRAKLGDGLDGVREYLQRYPYSCIEQQLSRAVVLRDRGGWDLQMQRLPAYLDRDGLLRYFPTEVLQGDDSLTAYVLAIANEAGWPLPDATRARMIDALKRFVQGRVIRSSALATADLAIRKLAAIEALSRYEAADPAMLDSLTIEPDLWPTSAVIDWLGILDRIPKISNRDARRAAALQILRSRLNFQGTIMSFSTERRDALWWLMISSDSNANRVLLAVLERPEWRADVPRLVRGSLSRQQSGHWNTTVANAWGVLAMEKFSARFESAPVTGTTTLAYGPATRPMPWQAGHNTQEAALPWQDAPGTLGVTHAGGGKPWLMVRATAALPLDKPLSSGYRIRRTLTPVEQKQVGRWSRGDIVRVRLDLEAQTDMSWVVVDDPVPGGASIQGGGLGGQSQLATRGERREGWAWTAFEERRFDAYRAYYRFVPKGTWSVEYTVRLNNPGTFLQPATRVEAMYAPEMFGELPNAAVTVER